ncbi:putative disease resistance RPP13-like protein 1 [Morella rubra]|uniref:Putative disease resistance RPP13-like protein 1 n=1 Tax=Morella rubra TaxID=262757 RepID=A0A6A1WPV8_9ROSI|nr:putative disease resistance RPP13-like protein 1 [Morella rubra]
MAEALVGGSFLSAFLKVLFDRIASREVIDFFRGAKLDGGLLEKLEITLLSVSAVLEDAEEKEVTMAPVKAWLDKMKDAVYDAEQIMDEIATEALRCKLDAEFQTSARSYGSERRCWRKPSEKLPTTSLVEESGICGRDENKEAIIDLLLSDDTNGKKISVIAVVGMGGIGKTTLAQLVYNDERVREHFDVEAWVCVSEEFDLFKITKSILDAVPPSPTCDNKDLNWLQVKLREKLAGKKFLVVLDDVWNKKYADWELLSNPFESGAPGSKVIVTTRDNDVASAMRASASHQLKELSEEDCWSLFTKHAFHDGNSVLHLRLQELGRQIVEKCKGLPLAIKTIGALLRSKLDIEEWDRILRSELWDLPVDETNILPALRLSYKYLPPPLKHCFAYCSIFPKDCTFRKEQVILLWMAEGFLQQSNNKTMGEVGEEYFCALVSRSLFQQFGERGSHFGMHDLVNDLAKFVCGQFSFRLEVDRSHENINKTRHVSYIKDSGTSPKFEALYEAKQLRTFLLSPYHYLPEKVMPVQMGRLKYLETLTKFIVGEHNGSRIEELGKLANLRGSLEISELQNVASPRDASNASMKDKRHLKKLVLGWNAAVTTISESQKNVLDSLQPHTNLKILVIWHYSGTPKWNAGADLEGFDALESLPEEIVGYNSCLRELKIKNCSSLASFPRGGLHSSLGKLELIYCDSLRSVPLGFFPKLYNISIEGCRNLESITVPEQHEDDGTMNFNSCLQELRIKGCSSLVSLPRGGLRSALKILTIKDCMKLELPTPLDYPFLERLQLYRCDSIRSVPLDLLSSLSEISISGCTNLESLTVPEQNQRDLMTSTIWISHCPNFVSFPKKMHILLPSLRHLSIINCPKVESFSEGGLPSNLNSVVIEHCDKLVANRMGCGLQKLPFLTRLEMIGKVEDVGSFPEAGLLPNSLTFLKFGEFPNMKSLDKEGLVPLTALKNLGIWDCPKLRLMPEDGLPASLSVISIYDCPILKKKWQKKRGKEWRKIAHVPNIYIDDAR